MRHEISSTLVISKAYSKSEFLGGTMSEAIPLEDEETIPLTNVSREEDLDKSSHDRDPDNRRAQVGETSSTGALGAVAEGRSLMYIRKSKGPKTDSWGTPI
jgi:hypothetical protein